MSLFEASPGFYADKTMVVTVGNGRIWNVVTAQFVPGIDSRVVVGDYVGPSEMVQTLPSSTVATVNDSVHLPGEDGQHQLFVKVLPP